MATQQVMSKYWKWAPSPGPRIDAPIVMRSQWFETKPSSEQCKLWLCSVLQISTFRGIRAPYTICYLGLHECPWFMAFHSVHSIFNTSGFEQCTTMRQTDQVTVLLSVKVNMCLEASFTH